MARPREFDPDTALEGAMQVFWSRGYGATNLPDLLEAMGLTRGSFYKAFGDKRAVYLQVLRRYDVEVIGSAVALLADRALGAGAARILALFEQAFAGSSLSRRGCLVCNAMVELGPSDAEVARLTAQMCLRLQRAIEGALRDDRDGAARAENDDGLGHRASAITNIYFGAQAISRAGTPQPDWRPLLADLMAAPAP